MVEIQSEGLEQFGKAPFDGIMDIEAMLFGQSWGSTNSVVSLALCIQLPQLGLAFRDSPLVSGIHVPSFVPTILNLKGRSKF